MGELIKWVPTVFNDEQKQLIKRKIAKDHDDDEIKVFLMIASRAGLDPLSRQIYSIKRKGVCVVQTSIDGLRLIAERTGERNGNGIPEWCGTDKVWHQVWLESFPPAAARFTVYRKGHDHPYTAVARFSSYSSGEHVWHNKPEHMIVKCAEALALRMAFPQELSGLYGEEEIPVEDTKYQALGSTKRDWIDLRKQCEEAGCNTVTVEKFIAEHKGKGLGATGIYELVKTTFLEEAYIDAEFTEGLDEEYRDKLGDPDA